MEEFLIKKAHKIKKMIREQDFIPNFLSVFLNPFYFSRKALYFYISKCAKKIQANSILDVGCGKMPYRELFNSKTYTGLEYDTPIARQLYNADIYYDGEIFPFENQTFDCALSFQVLEHVKKPKLLLSEINRVLKPNGTVLLTAPFIGDEHEQPNDYFRFTSFGMKQLFVESGFEIIEFHKTQNDISTIIQLINFCINKKYAGKNIFLLRLFCSFFNIVGLILMKIFPKSNDMYSDNVVWAKKIEKDINQ